MLPTAAYATCALAAYHVLIANTYRQCLFISVP